jgi:hypothetical protein
MTFSEIYEFNGFKLFRRTWKTGNQTQVNSFDIIVQYKGGSPFKIWSEEILRTTDGETHERWCPESNIAFLANSDEFIKNLSEEDIFTIFL